MLQVPVKIVYKSGTWSGIKEEILPCMRSFNQSGITIKVCTVNIEYT